MQQVEARPYDDEIDLRRYLDIIWRRRNLLAGVVIAAVILTLTVSLLIPRQWQARTTVMVPEPPKVEQTQAVGGVQVATPAVVYSQETYARLLKSTVLLERVISRLHLRMTTEDLAGKVKAKPIRDTRLIEVSVRGSAGDDVAAIASALAGALVEYDREVISAELTQARKFVEGQLTRARGDLQVREQILKEFNQRENLAALEAEANRKLAQLSSLRQAYDQNRLDLGVASRRLAQLKKELAATSALRPGSTSTQENTLNISLATQLRSRLADLEAQRAALLERYTPSHPSVVAVEAQIEQTRREVGQAETREPRSEELRGNTVREQLESQNASLEVEVAGLQARDRLLARGTAQGEQEFRVLNSRVAEKRAQLNRLTREVDAARNTFATISAKATEAVVAEGMKSGFVRVVDRTDANPVPRGTTTKVALAAILGMMAGLIFTFVTEYLGTPVPAATQVPAISGASNSYPSSRAESQGTSFEAPGNQEENAQPKTFSSTKLG